MAFEPSTNLILRACEAGVSKGGPMLCGLWPSFETPAAPAPQNEVLVSYGGPAISA
jgi:hypothetical protein